MPPEASLDAFLIWVSTLPDAPKRKQWQQKFARKRRFNSDLSREWSSLVKAGCDPNMLEALLWEIVASDALDIIDRFRHRIKTSEKERGDSLKVLTSLSTSMRRTSEEIQAHLVLLNHLYAGVLEERKKSLAFASIPSRPETPSQTQNPIEDKPNGTNDSVALAAPDYLAEQLSAWADSLSNALPASRKRPTRRRIHDAVMFMPILNYVSLSVKQLPFSSLAKLLTAALQEAGRRDSVTADQLRMIWNRNR